MAKLRTASSYPGVYTRLSKRKNDTCYEIVYYDIDGNSRYEKIGWHSEGVTLEQAAQIRADRVAEQKKIRAERKKKTAHPPRQVKRVKTKFPGVYYHDSSKRICEDGKPDRCYDIVWYIGEGKYKWEKIGWRSEGYNESEAIRIRGERIRSMRHPEFYELPNDISMDESWKYYVARWLPNLRESKNFIARYNKYLQPKFGSCKLSDIKTYHIEEFKQFLFSKNLSPARIKLILSDLRRIIRKMVEWEFYNGPLPKFHMPKVENERVRYFSIQETKDYLLELSLYSCEMYFIAKIEAYTGIRLDDILRLTKQDIDIKNGIIYTDGKTGRHSTYIADGIRKDIEYLLNKANTYLFTNKNGEKFSSKYMSNKFSQYISYTNINKGVTERKYKYVFHCGRHFFGSLLAEEGVSLYTIQKMLGHKDSKTTQRYAKLSPNSQRNALRQLDISMSQGENPRKLKN